MTSVPLLGACSKSQLKQPQETSEFCACFCCLPCHCHTTRMATLQSIHPSSLFLSVSPSIISIYRPIHPSMSLSIYLSHILSIRPSIFLSIFLSIYWSIHQSIPLIICPSIHHINLDPSINVSFHISNYCSSYPSIFQYIYLFINVSVCPSIHPSIPLLICSSIISIYRSRSIHV